MSLIERYERYVEKMKSCRTELENELNGLRPRDLTHDELGYYGYVMATIDELTTDISVSECAIQRLKSVKNIV